MKIGYARVSQDSQNLNRQIDNLKNAGCEKIFVDKQTGSKLDRKELNELLNFIRENDLIIIDELTRLSRSVKDLFHLVDIIHDKKAHIKSLKEIWLDTTSPQGKLLFTVFAGISEFERDLIKQRTKEGLASARARGKKGGRPPLDQTKINLALTMYDSKHYTISEITKTVGISSRSLYNALEKTRIKRF